MNPLAGQHLNAVNRGIWVVLRQVLAVPDLRLSQWSSAQTSERGALLLGGPAIQSGVSKMMAASGIKQKDKPSSQVERCIFNTQRGT